jgi:hypothetical protein
MNKEKQLRKFEVNYSVNWTYGIEISKLKEDINELEKLGANYIDIEAYDDYGNAYVSITAFNQRLETDEEFSFRIAETNKRNEEIKRRELEQLERLKEKYGK